MSRSADPAGQQDLLSRAVWQVLAAHGLERLTIRAVASAAGCTTGLVMHRFPNRRSLLRHARQLLHERTLARVEALEADAPTHRAALRAVLLQGMALDEETVAESVVWTGFLAAAVADDDLISLHRANNAVWRERVTRLVRAVAHQPAEESADRLPADRPVDWAETAALALIALVEGAAALGSADPHAYPPGVQVAMLDTTLVALGLD